MSGITIEHFSDYFHELHGHDPYDWQCRLATKALTGGWPGAIDLPTGSGKTACLDIAVFALACQASLPVEKRNAPRRLFFCVNRRVIVDEAYQRAKRIAETLWKAEQGDKTDRKTLRAVATALRTLAGTLNNDGIPPLDAIELRGGIYRDNRWARSATQPTIICTTLDQLGSRLLFRGYGVSQGAAPIQAALTAYDSLILLDEAHISRPFLQTLEQVQRYLDADKWAEKDTSMKRVVVVPMTATPPDGVDDKNVIRLSEKDRENEFLSNRLEASKPTELKQVTDVAKAAEKGVVALVKAAKPLAIGIIVNRVATAKAIYQALQEEKAKEKKPTISPDTPVELVIGSMRPIDRDKQAERLRELIGPDRPDVTEKTSIVVATQCLEVGADYDFDVMITECASLDALRQRFGRLNRGGREIDAEAVVLVNNKDVKEIDKLDHDKPLDPIYGNALSWTWNWIWERPSRTEEETKGKKTIERRWIDFGIDAFNKVIDEHGDSGRIPANLLAPSASMDAPVMLPAYVDFWCQTSPKPVPDPDVSLFIHGPRSAEPDVQICWRADLTDTDNQGRKHWCNIVAMLPPTSAECITLPISRLRRWLTGSTDKDDSDSDLLAAQASHNDDKKEREKENHAKLKHSGVLWRGPKQRKAKKQNQKETELIESLKDLSPGDTLVLPVSTEGVEQLGHLPEEDESIVRRDVGEIAFTRSCDRAALRLHSSLRSCLPNGQAIDVLFARATDRDNLPTVAEWRELLSSAANALDGPGDAGLKKNLQSLAKPNNLRVDLYPDKSGVVLSTRKRLDSTTDWYVPALDDGDDDTSRTQRITSVILDDHTQHVVDCLKTTIERLPLSTLHNIFEMAAKLHDLGKADERFQAMLRRTDCTDAWLLTAHNSALIAKSDGMPQTPGQRAAAQRRSGLPKGFRHEMLSVQLAERSGDLPERQSDRSLLLHLIAAHHGYSRPFAPVVIDDDPPGVSVSGINLSTEDRLACPSHGIDSGIAERFWALTRRYGWWGLAYLEATLRLADHQASAAEDEGIYENDTIDTLEAVEATT